MDITAFKFKETDIPILFEKSEKKKYQTPKFQEIMRIIKEKKIKPLEWKEVLDWFFYKDEKIPQREKKGVQKITVLEVNHILCLEMESSKITYKNLLYVAENTGWYFYLTGVELGKSKLCEIVDQIDRIFSLKDIQESWRAEKDINLDLINICSRSNSTCFLLRIGEISILLDAGFPINESDFYINRIRRYTDDLNAIFLSHAHYDHSQSLSTIIEKYPNTILLCSATTLDFFIYRNSLKKWSYNESKLEITISDEIRNIIKNSVLIRSKEKLSFEGGEILFFNAGHMPGALMINFIINDFSFLYTGDFSFYDYQPIEGVINTIKDIRKPVDFVLIDSTMSNTEYKSPKTIFNSLLNKLKIKASYGNHVLIGADPASTAIIFYLTIFNHFRKLQLQQKFDKRPLIVMGRETLEYVRIVQQRKQDLHTTIQKKIVHELNPFTSAIARFCDSNKEIYTALNQKNVIFIFGPSDLDYGIIQDLFAEISQNHHNLIYLSGALRSKIAIELASGQNNVILKNIPFTNYAEVF
ncbi:MAG: MBL fold metallo-hydrolase, partial [Candidatus Heimdallarchaeota archaeon]|nr:MBL fold metallo-hydrolase [Candidatus Heimdallarchaeota archaeon]MCK4878484.1 MBL fold metallo-hydrolase [Candidatus Heimdallarchaeota archaeon]